MYYVYWFTDHLQVLKVKDYWASTKLALLFYKIINVFNILCIKSKATKKYYCE